MLKMNVLKVSLHEEGSDDVIYLDFFLELVLLSPFRLHICINLHVQVIRWSEIVIFTGRPVFLLGHAEMPLIRMSKQALAKKKNKDSYLFKLKAGVGN